MSTHVVNLNQSMVKNEVKTVRKWGNGLGILLPKSMIDNYDLKIGDDLKFIFENDKFIIENNKEVLNDFCSDTKNDKENIKRLMLR